MAKQRKPPAVELFHHRVAENVKSGMTRPEAIRAVVTQDPALHRMYLAHFNANRPRVLPHLQSA